ncbi:Transposase IS200 like protein [Xanthomonas sp. GW]|uniref:transposase n=1 Tax=Xanthomonas sp. GW TaxID=2724121 RepID=UPI0018630D18|nr:transposase [Xanthomonas sp. GW]QNH23380.1 Transposase IS200 like protein [Xanthomonas sp. GW]
MLPPLDLPGVAQHIVQRGNGRQPCFFTDIDRTPYLQDLHELSLKLRIAVHAYVSMTNHVHLLLTSQQAGTMPTPMQSLGRCYVRYINSQYRRTGTLWKGRYKSCTVQDEVYLLRCYRYIELNPVRAGMAADPADYPWSSHSCNGLGQANSLAQPHRSYLAIAPTGERADHYRRFVLDAIKPDETAAIRLNLQRQHALGNNRFRAVIEYQPGHRAGPAARMGRPPKVRLTGEGSALCPPLLPTIKQLQNLRQQPLSLPQVTTRQEWNSYPSFFC